MRPHGREGTDIRSLSFFVAWLSRQIPKDFPNEANNLGVPLATDFLVRRLMYLALRISGMCN